jgi:carbamoyltransferase
MIVLGLHYGHDGSACIVKDGKLVSAISSERVTRKKKFHGVTNQVIDYVLTAAGLEFNQIDEIALTDYIKSHSHNTLTLIEEDDTCGQYFGNQVHVTTGTLRGKQFPVYVIPHHLAHCASAYYTSNFDSAWCFSMDSSGYAIPCNSLVARGQGNKLTACYCPMLMVGYGYAAFTEYLGIGNPIHKAGSTMGLASYGKPLQLVLDNINRYVRQSFFNVSDDYAQYYKFLWQELSGTDQHFDLEESSTPRAQNLAASIQYIFEQSILKSVKEIENNDVDNLCLSGGSLLNCNANSLIKTQSQFKNLHHFPACGDDGVGVGAALYLAHHINDEPRYNYSTDQICYLGQVQKYVEPDYNKIATMISSGKVIAWFMAGSEYGPRALGHRSILADPRNFHTREILNFVVKKREWFRPFAPSVLEEHCSEWFDFVGTSPYMLYTAKVLKPKEVPAITHVDGTARMQTVNESQNLPYYRLIKEFYKITGIPMLVNTSLNGNGEPILETEEDALDFFKTSNVDAMVLNGRIIIK